MAMKGFTDALQDYIRQEIEDEVVKEMMESIEKRVREKVNAELVALTFQGIERSRDMLKARDELLVKVSFDGETEQKEFGKHKEPWRQ